MQEVELLRCRRDRRDPCRQVEHCVVHAVDRTRRTGAAGVEAHDVEAVEHGLRDARPHQTQVGDPRLAGTPVVEHQRPEALIGHDGRTADQRDPHLLTRRFGPVDGHGERAALEAVAAVGPRQRGVEGGERRPRGRRGRDRARRRRRRLLLGAHRSRPGEHGERDRQQDRQERGEQPPHPGWLTARRGRPRGWAGPASRGSGSRGDRARPWSR